MKREKILNKKFLKILLIALAVLLIVVFLSQNDAINRNYPFRAAPKWESDDPPFSIEYSRDENGVLTSYAVLEWNDEILQVSVCFLMGDYEVYPATSSYYEDRLFGGTWKYRDGDLVLIIKEDFLFDNQYSQIVFSPVAQIQQSYGSNLRDQKNMYNTAE